MSESDSPSTPQPPSSPAPEKIVGIDVSKDKWDAHILPDGKYLTVPATPEGLQQLVKFLPPPGACLIVLEASGGYEADLMCDLQDLGHRVARVNPKRVRDFAKSEGQYAKTDRLDAHVLARFGWEKDLVPSERIPEQRRELNALVTRRRQLLAMRTMESNRRANLRAKKAEKSLEKMIRTLDAQIKEMDAAIKKMLENDDDWKAKTELLASVPGVGTTTAAALVAELPELGQTNRQEIAALAGVAPMNNDSGTKNGPRSATGGRRSLRSALYMAVVAAMRFNPVIQEFSQRLAKAGKTFKQRVIACMRKLLVILNTMLKNNQPWSPKLHLVT